MQSVVERVINLLIYLLESLAPVTADQIRQTVPGYDQSSDEAFHRMFERDKDVLRKLGVPLDRQAMDAWEIDFGYTVDPARYAIADPHLTEEEMAALSLASRMVRLGEEAPAWKAYASLGVWSEAQGWNRSARISAPKQRFSGICLERSPSAVLSDSTIGGSVARSSLMA